LRGISLRAAQQPIGAAIDMGVLASSLVITMTIGRVVHKS